MNSITTIFEWNITDQQAKKMFEDTDIRISAIVNNFSLQLEKGANETEWLVRRQIKFFVLQIHPYSTPYLCIPWRGFHRGGLKPPGSMYLFAKSNDTKRGRRGGGGEEYVVRKVSALVSYRLSCNPFARHN